MTTIYLVPHTHFDAAWVFSTEEYLKINEIIIESALKIMEDSDFKFCLEQTYLLEAIEKRNPDLWSKIAARIKEGRIEIVDGQYLMPDTMLPTVKHWSGRYCWVRGTAGKNSALTFRWRGQQTALA
jgi:alpha-mannosidase